MSSESPPRLSPGHLSKVARQLNGHAHPAPDAKPAPGSPTHAAEQDGNDISSSSGPIPPDEPVRDPSSPDARSQGGDSIDSDQNMSSDPAGSEHSSETEEIDYIADLRRVKVCLARHIPRFTL